MKKVKDISNSSSFQIDDFAQLGFQATETAKTSKILSAMKQDKDCFKIFAFTANMVASGLRGLFSSWIENDMANLVITTGGAIDHDIIKAYADYDIASFNEDDSALFKKGINRLGNILINNSRYELLEKKSKPVFTSLLLENKKPITPIALAKEFGKFIGKTSKNPKKSFLYQCYKKNIPVYSPALIDSAIGLQIFFFRQDHADFIIDQAGDFSSLAAQILSAKKTGALILGGGSSKHFSLGLNLLRGGLDYACYVSTSNEFDGSLSGAAPKEAKSWGKISKNANSCFVHGEATLVFPLLHHWVLDI